jgi:hypothetical protein
MAEKMDAGAWVRINLIPVGSCLLSDFFPSFASLLLGLIGVSDPVFCIGTSILVMPAS